jgi:hypothetical protein
MYYSIISTVWKKNSQFSVLSTVQSPKKYFYCMKNQKYGEKNRLDIYKYRTIKKIWGQTPISALYL